MSFCASCEVWSRDPACWICGQPGTTDPRTRPQRSWNGEDAAEWEAAS